MFALSLARNMPKTKFLLFQYDIFHHPRLFPEKKQIELKKKRTKYKNGMIEHDEGTSFFLLQLPFSLRERQDLTDLLGVRSCGTAQNALLCPSCVARLRIFPTFPSSADNDAISKLSVASPGLQDIKKPPPSGNSGQRRQKICADYGQKAGQRISSGGWAVPQSDRQCA